MPSWIRRQLLKISSVQDWLIARSEDHELKQLKAKYQPQIEAANKAKDWSEAEAIHSAWRLEQDLVLHPRYGRTAEKLVVKAQKYGIRVPRKVDDPENADWELSGLTGDWMLLPEAERKLRREIRDEWQKRFTLVFTAVIALSTGLYTLAAIWSLWELKKSTDAARQAAIIADQTLKITYRPRVVIQSILPQQTSLDNGKLALSFKVLNYGPISARNLKVYRFENISTLDHISQLPYPAEPLRDYPKMLASNTPTEFGIYGEKILSKEQIQSLTRTDNLAIAPSRVVATFSVVVEYEDDFSKAHHTEACILLTLPPQQWWTYCPWQTQMD